MTSAISQLVYMPNFRAIGQSVWEKNGNTQTETQKDRKTDRNTDTLEFYIYRYQTSIYPDCALFFTAKLIICY